jgi:hypothetical protein
MGQTQVADDQDDRPRKIMLMGTSESGKSTIRHMFENYLGFNNVYWIVVYDILILARTALKLDFQLAESTKQAAHRVITVPTNTSMEDLRTLWKDNQIRELFEMRHRYPDCQIFENFYYFADLLMTCDRTSELNPRDYIRLFVRTSGVVDHIYVEDDTSIRLVDPGGTRSQRRKWPLVWKDSETIIYCISLTCFRLMAWEDTDVNRYQDTCNVFDQMTQNVIFKKCKWVLLLSHRDLLDKYIMNLTEEELATWLPEYSGLRSAESVTNFILQQFVATYNKNVGENNIWYLFMNLNGETKNDIVRENFKKLLPLFTIERALRLSDVTIRWSTNSSRNN